jgi:hypothetical protein
VHPPPFRRTQRLSDWPDCRLELHCRRGQSVYPVRLLMRDHGDRTFAEVLAKLRCKQCRKPPAPVYLCAGHREHTMGARRSIELVPTPIYPRGRNQISTTSGGSAGWRSDHITPDGS